LIRRWCWETGSWRWAFFGLFLAFFPENSAPFSGPFFGWKITFFEKKFGG
jgi:hypothetical protein